MGLDANNCAPREPTLDSYHLVMQVSPHEGQQRNRVADGFQKAHSQS